MEDYKRSRKGAKAAITRIATWMNKNLNSETNVHVFVSREEQLCKAFNDYCNAQDQIESMIDTLDNTLSDQENREEIENNYFQILGEIRLKITNLQSKAMPNSNITPSHLENVQHHHAKLPQVNVPTFSGNIADWESFYQLFTALIMNDNSLSEIHKFIYLKSFLKDEPLQMINALQLTNNNFKIAIDTLVDRYQDNVSIINAQINILIDLDKIQKPSAITLREFNTTCKRTIASLKNLNCPVEHWDLLLLNILERKLDYGTRRAFQMERDITLLPTIHEFLNFLDKRCKIFENLNESPHNKQVHPVPQKISTKRNNFLSSFNASVQGLIHSSKSNNNEFKCTFCNKLGHRIYSCPEFKILSINDRKRVVQTKHLCYNCLGVKHTLENCRSSTCTICMKRHHSLLHESIPIRRQPCANITDNSSHGDNRPNSCNSKVNELNPTTSTTINLFNQTSSSRQLNPTSSYTLLATATVQVFTKYDQPIQIKALLDPGSQNSFITESLLTQLQYIPYEHSLNIVGVNENSYLSTKMINLNIHSNAIASKQFTISCAVLPKITCPLPQIKLNPNQFNIPEDIILADPNYHITSTIDLLLGADIYYQLLQDGLISLGTKLPYLQNTWLGWVIAGSIPIYANNYHTTRKRINKSNNSSLALTAVTNSELNETLNKFWEIENIVETSPLNPDEELAERNFTSTTKILPNGYFQVNIPLVSPQAYSLLGDSYFMAKRRFLNLEKRFEKDPKLYNDYKQFIYEYLALDHARVIPLDLQTNNNVNKFFLPHHGVIKQSSSTTKLRVVFDGSAKSSTKVSLNDISLKGYQVQPELFHILCRFRTFEYALTTDIKKMFRQIKVNPEQTFLQNILWRNNPGDPLQCIQLTTVTYGTKSAPFLATRVLKELADKNIKNYPLAGQALLQQCYVDDILTGCSSITELHVLYDELKSLLNLAKFELHKWHSNSQQFMKTIDHPITETNEHEIIITEPTSSSKVLGLSWNFKSDSFSISIPDDTIKTSYTKREVLSLIAKMFDPLGLIAPVIVLGKLVMQQLWASKLNWDDSIEQPILNNWITLINNIHLLKNLKISRYLFHKKKITRIEIHTFADASMKAYAACIYIRAIYSDNSITTNLITSKSRVAPMKTLTIPRLELCAMHLAAKLTTKIKTILDYNIKINSTYMWSDSEIALCWIASHPSRWSTFVANRVSQIQELTKNCSWKHVRSEYNPADLSSRGLLPQDLITSKLWWHGPRFLQNHELNLTQNFKPTVCPQPPEEKRTILTIASSTNNDLFDMLFKQISKFLKLQRIIAYCYRFIHNTKNQNNKTIGPLTPVELEQALHVIFKRIQCVSFAKEIKQIGNKQPISNKGIAVLAPFIDQHGLMCVGGRLQNATIPYRQKHPIILPSKNNVVRAFMELEHLRLGHAGASALLSNLRLRVWPLNGLREVKKIIHTCVTCYRFNIKLTKQIMGNLPKERVTAARPFDNVGVDFGGPIMIKTSKLRKATLMKSYIAVFVCMCTKAVHIELVTSLSTDSFLMTLKRFISRRGNPSIIYSDNATNFKGARNQLREFHEFFVKNKMSSLISDYLSTKGISWKFIPPHSPHWGGIWESAIKSCKYHLYRLIKDNNFTFEEIYTVLTQIEAILNSRPICAMTANPSDFEILTPGHFLLGKNLTAFPEPDCTAIKLNRLNFYQALTNIQQTFWKRWSMDYLNRLQNRPKWYQVQNNLKLNDLVLLKEDNTPPLTWPVARIIELLPGSDGCVRAVKIRTKSGEFVRPVTKLGILPIYSDSDN